MEDMLFEQARSNVADLETTGLIDFSIMVIVMKDMLPIACCLNWVRLDSIGLKRSVFCSLFKLGACVWC